MGPQVAVCHRIVNTLNPIRFDVTLESFLFSMCWSYVVPQPIFAPEWLVTQIASGFNLCVDIKIVVIEKGFNLKLLSTKVANKFTNHFRLLLLSDLILRNRKIARKMVARILLMLLIYFGRKYTVCGGPSVAGRGAHVSSRHFLSGAKTKKLKSWLNLQRPSRYLR